MREWTYAVTFEQPDARPPLTVRGTLVCGSASAAASNAMRSALAVSKGVRFESCVILLYKAGALGITSVADAGARGGRARAKNLSPEQIAEIGRKAAAIRWRKPA